MRDCDFLCYFLNTNVVKKKNSNVSCAVFCLSYKLDDCVTQIKSIYNKNTQIAPDCSGSPEILKAIFLTSNRATKGSSCGEYRKKLLK